jgi:DNA modification methylase
MTELMWDGKYKDGKKVSPIRIQLPFQTVETVNESAQQRQLTLDRLFAGQETEWRNRLIWGDKKYVLPSLLGEFGGQINLIYIDPPFATGANFSFTTTVPESDESFTKEPNIVEQKAYRDTWGQHPDSYLQWFYETAILLRELLSESGIIYVHCDWRLDSMLRLVMDEVFGKAHLINELIWHYRTFQGQTQNYFAKKHDTIFLYAKSDNFTFHQQFATDLEDTIDSKRWAAFLNDKGQITGSRMPIQDSRFTRYLRKWIREHNREPNADDVIFEALGQPVDSVWDMKGLDPKSTERVNYPTQKPEALLERIIKASSNEGDIILDCFCGSGTTATVAEKLSRRWITCDLGRFAIHTTRKRLLSIENIKPFVVQNLGKYERQAWQTAEFADLAQRANVQLRYRNFILDLYNATPIDGYNWLHGIKAGRLVHVGTVDSPISLGEVKAIVNEFWRVKGKDVGEHSNGIDILGWDFAFDMNETAKQMAADANIHLAFKKIPREVLEKKAVEQGDIVFYELAALDVQAKTTKRSASVELQNFFVPPDDVPEDVRKAISHWSQWIDYWAVDWHYRDDTFHNQWQTYRTKKEPKIVLRAFHEYAEPGTYTIVIKVIDILGNDTTRADTVCIQ